MEFLLASTEHRAQCDALEERGGVGIIRIDGQKGHFTWKPRHRLCASAYLLCTTVVYSMRARSTMELHSSAVLCRGISYTWWILNIALVSRENAIMAGSAVYLGGLSMARRAPVVVYGQRAVP